MSVSDLHSKFTFNRAHWLRILQQDHHHHVRSSFFSWWSIKLHQTNSRQKSFMRFLYSLLLGLLECECFLLSFFFCVWATNNEWLCATRSSDDVIFLSLRCGGLHNIVRFLWKLNVRRTIMCFWNLLSRQRNDTRTNKLFWWNFWIFRDEPLGTTPTEVSSSRLYFRANEGS